MNKEKHLETILILVLALGIFFWITHKPYLLLIAGILAFIGVFIPLLAGKIHWAWMKLAHVMGYVMSKVLLTLVYVIVLLPLSFISRILGKKNGIRLKPGAKSYFTDRHFTYTKESLENVW
ncbi:MAG: SxtJ family membrane protein [Ginsengibacter sp.]